jgi:hypothetical protein
LDEFYNRSAFSGGPNHIWAFDGHDKLTKYGLSIHGCVDVFSGKIIWLRVWTGNHDPDLVEMYYLESVKKYGVFPYSTQSDYGSETIGIFKLQQALHDIYDTGAESPHRYVTSPRNQKIESLWHRYLAEMGRNLMENLEYGFSNGIYKHSDCLEEYLYLYIWLPLVQSELDKYVERCDNQTRQKSKVNTLPSCAPLYAYNNPNEFGAVNCGYSDVTLDDLIERRLANLYKKDYLIAYLPIDFIKAADYIHQELLDAAPIRINTAWSIFAKMNEVFRILA